MNIALFSTDISIIDEWKKRVSDATTYVVTSLDELLEHEYDLILADFDTVATEINRLFTQGNIPKHLVVLERSPLNATGKMLVQNGVMGYGNTRMLSMHLRQLIQAVIEDKIWVYPELLKSIIKVIQVQDDFDKELMQRLSPQEIEVSKLVLHGLSNDAIAKKLSITTRTVKAHLSSIFSKLHVSDRLSLVLLLKA